MGGYEADDCMILVLVLIIILDSHHSDTIVVSVMPAHEYE